jgi:hypothetical protein
MSIRSYAKIVTSINAIRAIGEGLPDVEKRSILKERSDELLILSKEAQKWALSLIVNFDKLNYRLENWKRKQLAYPPSRQRIVRGKYTLNFPLFMGVVLRGRNQRKAVLRNDYLKEKKWLSHIGMTRK